MAANPILCMGDGGPAVVRLQKLLLAKLRPAPSLKADGMFGPSTKVALQLYQHENWLSEDGVAGPCVWSALEGRDKYVILHNVTMVPQWTETTCWSAALAMLLGGAPRCMSPGSAAATAADGLWNDSDLARPENTQRFADSYRLTLLHASSWTAQGLANLLRSHGPLMMNLLWNAPTYLTGQGSSGHMLIIAGIRGDGTEDGSTIRICDPYPVGKGSLYSLSYGPFIRNFPTGTYQLYHK